MKYIPSQIVYFLKSAIARRNIKVLLKFVLILLAMISIYTILFHYIMEYEGRQFSWLSGVYWTLVTMSTLGFGDITFTTDIGKVFSVIVLLSGVIFLLVMLPFTFIQFFYAPWLDAQTKARTPRNLPSNMQGHVILTNCDPISIALAENLMQYNYKYVFVISDLQKAVELHDMNYKIVLGELDEPETYRNLQIHKAALVVVNNNDMLNTNITFTIRSLSKDVPIVATADSDDSVDILELAGASYVFQFAKMLGNALARRAVGSNMKANIIGRFGDLLIAEAPAMRTPLEGKTLKETRLRDKTGVTVVGMWERGAFQIPLPDSRVNDTTVLVLAGSEEQLNKYDEIIGGSYVFTEPVVIIGGGRVGRATSEALKDRGINYRVIESDKELIENKENYIFGNAADLNILIRAGINEAPSVFITIHDDDINIYLTIYCRKLRPDIQIISRATLDRNISKLHKAGADLVMSYASIAINTIINILKPDKALMLTEGLNVFSVPVPALMVGQNLIQTGIRQRTGCSVVAINTHGSIIISPDPYVPLKTDDILIIIGTTDAEKKLIDEFALYE
jgi:Trk K+ transport system NAD-binding subunit